MKRLYFFVILFLISYNVHSYDFSPLVFNVTFSDEFGLESPYKSYVTVESNGNYILSIRKRILYKNQKITLTVYSLIDKDQIPYDSSGEALLKAYFGREQGFDTKTLFPYAGQYFDSNREIVDISFSRKFKARDIQFINGYESDVIHGQDGTRIERDFSLGRWPETGYEDKLTYFFQDTKGLYSEYIIEVNNSWKSLSDYETFLIPLGEPKLQNYDNPEALERIKELYTLTNEELNNYQDQDDPRIQFMNLMNKAMTTFRFKDRPNIPEQNLGTVNDNRVRVRSSYDLSTDVLGHVNIGEEVIVMERSPEKQIIGDMEDYWYKIVSKESYIKGWMYGAFLDLKE